MKIYFLCLIALFYSVVVHAQNYTITVTITGLHNNNGKVYVELFKTKDGFPDNNSKSYKTINNTIKNDTCVLVLNDIPKGIYAIGYYHDENNNGKLDTNFLGIPKEGVGASNNAKGFLGPPKFSDAQFTLDKNLSMYLTISYL